MTPIVTASFVGTDLLFTKAIGKGRLWAFLKSGDCAVAVHGQREDVQGPALGAEAPGQEGVGAYASFDSRIGQVHAERIGVQTWSI